MRTRHYFLFLFLFCCPVSFLKAEAAKNSQTETQKNTQEESALKKSVVDAGLWLKLVDAQNYAKSWDLASLTLKLTIPKNNWIALMQSIRRPFGTVISRKLVEQRVAENPAHLPKGDYMVLLYSTSFSQRAHAHELLTLVLQNDGVWRVLTYQVQ